MADEQDGRALPSKDEVHGWLTERNNWGRWGDDDQRGAVNLIDAQKRVDALALARTGRVVSISRPYPKEPGPTNPNPAQHFMRRGERPYQSGAVVDYYGFIYHGHNHTHLDALSHVWDHRGGWQGRDPNEFVTGEGVTFGDVTAWDTGIITRGVLLDVPRHRGEPHVTVDRPVLGSELEEIAAAQGVEVGPGDALVVYSGRETFQAANPNFFFGNREEPSPGLHASCMGYIRPDRAPERPGHRSNYDPRREKQGITERINAATADVSHYRVVAQADLVKERFGGNPFAARIAVTRMKADGLVEERTLYGPKGGAYRVLSPTAAGAGRARAQGRDWGMDLEQRVWDSPLSKPQDMGHDVAIYRAARAEEARIEGRGATLRRIRTDAELQSLVHSRAEAARSRGGPKAADREREKAAEELHLPIQDGKVQYPDAQLEFLEPDGLTRGHVNIEVVSGNYRAADIAAKAAAGFQHARQRERASAVAHRPGREARPVERVSGGGVRAARGRTAGQGSYRTMKPIFFGVGITAALGRDWLFF